MLEADKIVDAARALGFHRVGIAPVAPAERFGVYQEWLAAGHAGEMTYLHGEERRDVRALLDSAKTVISVALSYGAPDLVPVRTGPRGGIARYARGADYHMVMKEKLRALAARVAELCGREVAARPCVDTAAVLERDLGERAGLGFVGKNTMLIAPGLGSYLMLGELLVDEEIAPFGDPGEKKCGACRLCLDACPTGAFVGPFQLDARRCVSYLTIEHMGPIPRDLRARLGTMIFGCDVCQEVCPFNAAVAAGTAAPPAPELAARARLTAPELIPLLGLGAAQYRQFVKRSALRRLHRAQLLRNVCVALGNAGDAAAIPALRAALATEKSALIRAHAAWALGRLGDVEHLRAHIDEDPDVRAEIEEATREA
jgi:epoxyqueuosine reductase